MNQFSWYNPYDHKTPEQLAINRYFNFPSGGAAQCKAHTIVRCQRCTDSAFKTLERVELK